MRCASAAGFLALVLVLGAFSAKAALQPTDCWFSVPDGERATCGRVEIPPTASASAASLPVAILHADTDHPASDPVLYIEGGPGASPFALGDETEERMDAWWSQTTELRRSRDVVLFDPRGAGRAIPNADCPELDVLIVEPLPATSLQRDEKEAAALTDCARRLILQGVDPATLTTPRAALDAFAVMGALGVSSFDIWAVSYGTRVAFAMLRDPPKGAPTIRAMVLDGVYPPNVNASEEAAWLAQRGMRHLFADCGANSVCRAAHPDFESRFAKRIAKLNVKPAEIWTASAGPSSHLKLTGGLVIDALLTMMAQADDLPAMPANVERVTGGRYLQLLPWLRSPWFGDPDTADGLALSIECRETVNPAAPERIVAARKRWAPYGAVADDDPGPRLCADWPVSVAAPAERLPVASPLPVLLFSGGYDTVTPSEWADKAAETLPKSRHAVFRTLGHGVTLSRSCPVRMMADFYANPDPAAVRMCADAGKAPVFKPR